MNSLKNRWGLACLTLLRPAGGPPLKRPYSRFGGDPHARSVACSRLLSPWTPHAALLWASIEGDLNIFVDFIAGRPSESASLSLVQPTAVSNASVLRKIGIVNKVSSRSLMLYALRVATASWHISRLRVCSPEVRLQTLS
jgi:hypothetical protein